MIDFKWNKKALPFFILAFITLSGFAQNREYITLQKDWKFSKGNPEHAEKADFDASSWQSVTLPHDWAISGPFNKMGDGNTGKLPWKGEGWYRKALDLPQGTSKKQVYLIFDGVMAFPKVYVNGKLAGSWDYGYNSFYVDITPFLNADGENILAVHANTQQHDSRWYPGAGIYRKVQMLITDPVHAAIWGTQITTPIIKPNYALVRLSSSIENKASVSDSVKVEQVVYNPQGIEVGRQALTRFVKSGKSQALEVDVEVANPQHWDIVAPLLYTAKTLVYQGKKLVDTQEITFGIRTIKFTPNDGFQLNGRRVQLKGVNLHHGHGPLGAAFYPRAMERQLEIMKSMGVNAIRNSHNVAAPELLELCDKMGILVFNEVFDKYDAKADITEDTDFEEFAQRNIKNFVTRDRNHPSVFLWSVGNEIGDVQTNYNNGFQRLHTMVNYVKKYDFTRPVTLVNDIKSAAVKRHFDLYDVHSWNYGRRYSLARQLEPEKSVVISESASTLSTRGFYEFPLPEKKTDFTKSLQVSSYDLNAPAWAEIADDDFMWQQDESYVAGEFVWTGFDYLGEPTPYDPFSIKAMGLGDAETSRSSYFGAVDLVGIPKDRYFLYKSYWKPEETTIHILPHWNWKGREGEITPVFVYTNGDCAELFVNGKSQGKQCKNPISDNSTERFRLMWKDVVYEPGEVKAIVYKDGKLLGEKSIQTAGEVYTLKLTADRTQLKADGMDLSYILIEAYDKNGNLAPLAADEVKITIAGKGHIAGVGNGNPQSLAPFQSDTVKLFYGKAMLIMGSGFETGTSKITVTAPGLKKASVTLTIE